MPRKSKIKVSLTIDSGLIAWIDKQVETFKFQSRSHAIEQAVYRLRQTTEERKIFPDIEEYLRDKGYKLVSDGIVNKIEKIDNGSIKL